ncbi:Ig-like domain-containing protein [Mycolicibacterium lacusdiani]|uniref:Ig-like domain-containing protein n=1 Tax=Mycolicibacterium lacusdiani TaxID=2895283 RepID=UPI001F1E8D88|nr:Ig-like domain-containing protein [Mycolicibacterium lacusdiani]
MGALAVALGVGTAIATPAGVAWASPEAAGDSTTAASQETGDGATAAGSSPSPADTTASQTTDSATTSPVTNDAVPTGPTPTTGSATTGSATTVDVAPGVIVSHSGGAQTSTYGSNAAEPTGTNKPRNDDDGDTASRDTTPVATISGSAATSSTATETTSSATRATTAQSPSATTAPAAPVVASRTIAPVSLTPTPPAPAVAVAPVQNVVSMVLSNVVAPALTSWLSAMQRGWTESPLAWMFLAAARREIGTAAVTEPAPTAMRLASAQVVATAVVNQAPTATATFLVPNPLTGAVTGTIVASDPEGVKPTITLTTKPAVGTIVYNATTATFTYTPTTAQRLLAGINPSGAGAIAMTVTVSDGVNKVPVQINVPIAAIPMGVRTDIGGVTGAGAIAATNTRAFVTNREAGTVTIIDTVTAKVLGTYAAGVAPDGIAVKQDGTRIYVSSSTGNTVTVLNAVTGARVATIAVAKPTSITMSPTGGSAYVLSYDAGKVVRISTSTNLVATTTTMPGGFRPTAIAPSPDNTRVYVATDTPTGGTAILSFAPTSTTTTQVVRLTTRATSLVVSPDNSRLYVGTEDGAVSVVDTKTRVNIGNFSIGGLPPTALAVSRDGTTLFVTDAAGRVGSFAAATGALISAVATVPTTDASQRPASFVTPDGTEMYVTDRVAGVVRVVTLTAPNAAPVAGTPTKGAPNATTGAVTGTLGVTDPNGDPLKYTVSGAPTKGTLTLTATGGYTYTPTAAARHNASTVGAPASVTTDTFTVTVTDGRRGVVTTTVTVNISPKNAVPTITKTVGAPNTSTGVVTGKVTGTDTDRDVLTYSTSVAPGKGTVTLTATGAFTYTPTAAARHAAQKLGATIADKQDTFTVAVSDGHGGVVTTAITVTVSPANAKPTGGSATVTQTDGKTGVVSGTLTAVDPDGDPLTFTSTTPLKGTLVIGANGSFTYTPSTAARDAASAPGATAAAKVEALTITVSDGYGGTATFTLSAPITAYPAGNQAPVTGGATVGSSSSAIGTVTGTVTATDPEGDALTYTVVTGPKKGVVKVDAVTGAYTYTPTVDARYTALVTPGVDTDVFTVTVRDALGAATTTTVSVTIVPPVANAIDQRPTSVAIHVPDLLFYSQADLNTALDKLQSVGITDLRVLVPWAAVQPLPGWNDWSAVDRVINGAAARNIKVLGILNSPPVWASVANTTPLAGMPANNAQFAAFAGAAAARYKGKVTAWEVWNEPNAIMFWQPGPNAAQYTALLKAAYPAIKAADPNAVVVAASVGATLDWFNLTVNPVRFVDEMYKAGAAGYFDALSFHPYQYTTPFSQGGYMFESPISQANRIYALMVANGDGHKKIWATEYGQPSSEASDANQAAYIGDFLRGWRALSYAGPAFIHTLVDRADGDAVEGSFGLFRPDWTPKPVVSTVVTVIAENDAIEAAKNASAL